MEPQPTPPTSGPFWVRYRSATVIAGLLLTFICAIGIGVILLALLAPTVTPEQEQLAQKALKDPDGGHLTLGHYGSDLRWESPVAGDYAVQDGMVVIPQTGGETTLAAGVPVVVYAPDGQDLGALPAPPETNTTKSTDWFLTRCQPALFHPSWWSCGLKFGNMLHY